MLYFDRIPINRIISAFENEIDWNKVDEYKAIFAEWVQLHPFPPISGYFDYIIETDIDMGRDFMRGRDIIHEKLSEKHIGQLVFYVTDGHHRTIAAIEAGVPFLWTQIDRSTLTTEEELIAWDKMYNE